MFFFWQTHFQTANANCNLPPTGHGSISPSSLDSTSPPLQLSPGTFLQLQRETHMHLFSSTLGDAQTIKKDKHCSPSLQRNDEIIKSDEDDKSRTRTLSEKHPTRHGNIQLNNQRVLILVLINLFFFLFLSQTIT